MKKYKGRVTITKNAYTESPLNCKSVPCIEMDGRIIRDSSDKYFRRMVRKYKPDASNSDFEEIFTDIVTNLV